MSGLGQTAIPPQPRAPPRKHARDKVALPATELTASQIYRTGSPPSAPGAALARPPPEVLRCPGGAACVAHGPPSKRWTQVMAARAARIGLASNPAVSPLRAASSLPWLCHQHPDTPGPPSQCSLHWARMLADLTTVNSLRSRRLPGR